MSASVYRFGPFRLDVAERTLQSDGQPVGLKGKAFDTLVALLEQAGRLSSHASLMDRIWPDTVVDPNNLQYNISLVRRALGDAAGVDIETVRGQGYRLHTELRVERAPSDARPAGDRPGQRTYFCHSADGTRLAYARTGRGPVLMKAANWLSHVELDVHTPIWPHWLSLLSEGRELVRYDSRGCGLSERDPASITFADLIDDLAAVFDAAQVESAPVLGISQGAAVAVAYAARHPERVSGLVLIGGCARGWRVKNSVSLRQQFEALMVLMRKGWGGNNPAFRQIFTTAFFPRASREQSDAFNELQRQSASAKDAARILSALGDVDVTAQLAGLRVPTLVLHARGDSVVPLSDGIELASNIPGSRFVPLESDTHVTLHDEPAWARVAQELRSFLGEVIPPA